MILKVLIAEDKIDQRELMGEMLPLFGGFEVTTVANGNEAIEHFLKNDVDVFVTDLRMYPSKDGGIKAIKTIRQISDLPIIVVSAYVDARTRAAAKLAGANRFMAKPAHMHNLAAMVRELGNKYHRQRAGRPDVIIEKERRLMALQVQQARMGIQTPPHITTEIEDLQKELSNWHTETTQGH